MDKVYLTADELFKEILTTPIDEDTIVHLATYSIYIGISKSKDWSLIYGPNEARKLINKTKDLKNFKLVVGAPYFMDEVGHIREYVLEYNKLVNRLIMTIDHLKLNCKVHETSHLKYYRVGDRVFVGGINLSGSDWVDVAIEIYNQKQKDKLNKIFLQTFEEASTDVDQYRKTTLVRKKT